MVPLLSVFRNLYNMGGWNGSLLGHNRYPHCSPMTVFAHPLNDHGSTTRKKVICEEEARQNMRKHIKLSHTALSPGTTAKLTHIKHIASPKILCSYRIIRKKARSKRPRNLFNIISE